MSAVEETYTILGRFLTQPIGEFFVGVIPARVLREIAREDIRRLEEKSARMHVGLERPISEGRVREIKKYIATVDATFPNSIIVVIDSKDVVQIDKNQGSIIIRRHEKVAKLIDGLHRLAGFDQSNWDRFELIVSVFFDLNEEDQALVFSTINLKQTKVTKSLVYDLFDLATTPSPYKTCHEIAKALNHDESSPFYRRIKLLGTNPRWQDEVVYKGVLTQGTFVERLLHLLTRDPVTDRDKMKRGEPIDRPKNELEMGLVFRQFLANQQDDAILKIMLNYFRAVQEVFPSEWQDLNNPLSRTIGYGALMTLLTDLSKIGVRQNSLAESFFKTYLKKAEGRLQLNFAKYSPSGRGESELYNDLKKVVIDA